MLQNPPLLTNLLLNEIRIDTTEKWTNFQKLIKRKPELTVLRRVFSRKRPTVAELSECLCSPQLFPFIENSPVQEKIDNLAQIFLSSKKIYRLRQFLPKREMEKLSDCYLLEDEFEALLDSMFSVFPIETHIGKTNKNLISTWISDTVLCRSKQFKQWFVYKEAPFIRAFRAKSVMPYSCPKEKRAVQALILKNLMAAVYFWTLFAIRQCISLVPSQRTTVLLWRKGFLMNLRNEMADLKKRYRVRRMKLIEKAQQAGQSVTIGRLKFNIVRQKLRPTFPKNSANQSKHSQLVYWKRIISMVDWCLKERGIGKKRIRDSCKILYQFLQQHHSNTTQKVTALTADVTKCFSAVKHSILIDILTSLMNGTTIIYSVLGFGRDNFNRYHVLCGSAGNGEEAIRILKAKIKIKNISKYETGKIESITCQMLLNDLRNNINSYYFKRGKTHWKVTRGVPQGHPLSSHLAHVYLNDFEQKTWNIADKSKMVYCRYEDDYVIFTTDTAMADEMLNPLFSGNNRHGLVANEAKSWTTSEYLKWCGVSIDLEKMKFAQKIRCNDKKMRRVALKEKQLTM